MRSCARSALGDYEDRERFSAWLTRILVNQCRTVLARSKRREPCSSISTSRPDRFAGRRR